MSYTSTVLGTANLADYYPMQEASGSAAADLGPAARGGVYTGGFTLGAAAPTPLGTGVTLDGSTGYVAVAGAVSPTAVNSASECWFRTADPGAAQQTIIYVGDANNDGYGLELNGTAGTSLQFLRGGLGFTTVAAVNDTNWHHVVLNIKPANAYEVYLDGALVFSAAAGARSPAAVMSVGSNRVAGHTFNGTVTQAAFYTLALPAATVAVHYAVGTGAALGGPWPHHLDPDRSGGLNAMGY